ncbi:hypothetical protein BX600DRAFT_477933 [Xylariales sp. PMI_506]|nr:hypothetical protein BX600DRAFT_477933 [Xylariales sp. PMI_506]
MAASSYTPISCALASIAVFTFTLIKTSPRSSTRFAAAVLLAALTYTFYVSFQEYCQNRGVRSLILNAAGVSFLSAVELLLVSKVDIQDISSAGSSRISASQILRAALLPFNWRRVGTKWQIELPPFAKDGSTPGRVRFLVRQLLVFLGCYLFLDLCTSGPPPDPSLFTKDKESILYLMSEDVTSEEVIFRIASTITFLINAAFGVIAAYNLLSIIFVALGDQPSNWPPVWYAWPSQAYSVRQFWGKYYHQGLRRALSGPADYIADIFLTRGSLLSRYVRLALVFLLSATLHHMAEGSEIGQLIFFTSQSVGIMLEDAVKATYKSTGVRLPRSIEYALGYLWVALWMFCMVPFWSYSTMRTINDPVRDQVTPGLFKGIMQA